MLTNDERQQYAEAMLGLASDRKKLEDVKADIKKHEEHLRQEIEPLINAVDDLNHSILMNDQSLRDLARRLYDTHHTKKLPFGLGIRLSQQLEYDDVDALAWAKSTGYALQLDRKKFEHIMMALPEEDRPDWVKPSTRVTVTIPTKIAEDEIRALIGQDDPNEVPF